MSPHSRAATLLPREPFAASALLTLAAVWLWYWLSATGITPLPAAVGVVAIETIAEVWCVSALPALWFANRRAYGAPSLLVAAIVPPAIVQLGIFVLGSSIPTDHEHVQRLQIVQFVLVATAVVGGMAAFTLLLLRAAIRRGPSPGENGA
jgi:hypothetical protein